MDGKTSEKPFWWSHSCLLQACTIRHWLLTSRQRVFRSKHLRKPSRGRDPSQRHSVTFWIYRFEFFRFFFWVSSDFVLPNVFLLFSSKNFNKKRYSSSSWFFSYSSYSYPVTKGKKSYCLTWVQQESTANEVCASPWIAYSGIDNSCHRTGSMPD